MWSSFLFTYLHYLCIILLVAAVFSEVFLIKKVLNFRELMRLIKVDSIYGVSAIFVVVTGLIRAFYFGKSSEYYFSNWIFNLKFSLFIVVGLLSILPTVTFLKLRKQYKNEQKEIIYLPKFKIIVWMIRIELLLLFIIPFLAVLMANGIGV